MIPSTPNNETESKDSESATSSREVEFEFTKSDYIFGLCHVFSQILLIRIIILFCALGLLVTILYRNPPQSMGQIVEFVTLIAVVCILIFLGLLLLNLVFSFLLTGKGHGVYGHHWIRVDSEGIHERSDTGEEMRRWKVVPFIAQSRHYMFAQVGNMQMHMIPKRAFPDSEAADAFWAELERLWKAGRANQPASEYGRRAGGQRVASTSP